MRAYSWPTQHLLLLPRYEQRAKLVNKEEPPKLQNACSCDVCLQTMAPSQSPMERVLGPCINTRRYWGVLSARPGTMSQYPPLLGCPISGAWHSFVPRIPWQRDPSRPMQICVKDVLDHPYQQQSQYECSNSFFHSSASWVSRHTSISRQARFHLIANGPWNVVLLACIVDRTRRRCTCDPDVFASKDLAARCEQRYQNCKRPHVYRSDHWFNWGSGSHNRHRVIVSVVEGAGEIALSIEPGSLSLHHRRYAFVS